MPLPTDASDHRTTIAEMTPNAWGIWRNHPVTIAFFAFMDDQYQNWRDAAVDILENVGWDPTAQHEDKNPLTLRGKLRAISGLQRLTLADMQAFYREAGGEGAQSDEHT